MKKKTSIILVVVALILIIWPSNPVSNTLGGVNRGQSYVSTTTALIADGHKVLRSNKPTEIGSIVVASSSATDFVLWDATSTTDIASTTIGTLRGGIVEGTYTFDTQTKRGLIVNLVTGFDGDYIINWR